MINLEEYEVFVELVRAEEDMDDATFLRHLAARHPEAFVSGPFPAFASEYVAECYRRFHRRQHELRIDLEHEHGPSRG